LKAQFQIYAEFSYLLHNYGIIMSKKKTVLWLLH